MSLKCKRCSTSWAMFFHSKWWGLKTNIILSEYSCHFVNLFNFRQKLFLIQFKINHMIHEPTANNWHRWRAPLSSNISNHLASGQDFCFACGKSFRYILKKVKEAKNIFTDKIKTVLIINILQFFSFKKPYCVY